MKTRSLLSLATCALMLGCGAETGEIKAVAQAFWDASAAGDTELARSYVSESSSFKPEASDEGDSSQGSMQLGDVEVDGDEATVATVVSGMNQDTPIEFEFATAMVREDGEWKVDMDKTTANLMQAAFGAMAEAMGNAFKGLAEGMAEGMKEGLSAMGDSLAKEEKR